MPSHPRFFHRLGALAATLVSACSVDSGAYTSSLALRAPVELAGSLLVLDTTRHRLTRLHDEAGAITADAQALDIVPAVEVVTSDRKKLLWLDSAFQKGKQKLAILDGTGQATVATLTSAFSGVALSADDQTALAWHAPGAAAQGIVIAAELALVQLTATPTVQTTAIAGLAAAPLDASVSPPLTAADGLHRVAWVSTASAVGIADFGPQATRTLVVPLVATGSTAQVIPRRVLARVDGTQLHLYLVATGSNDAVHLTIDVAGTNLSASLDQLASGPQPTDLALIDTAAGLRLLTVHQGAAQLSLIHPGTGAATMVSLTSIARHIQPYTGADGKAHALLWSDDSARLQRVDIEDLEKKKGKAVHDVLASSGVTGVTALASQFLLQHGTYALSTYDAEADKLTAVSNAGKLVDVQISGAQLILLTTTGATTRVSRIDLAKLAVQSLETEFTATGLLRWGDHGLALWNGGDAGALLAFPDGVLDLESAKLSEGIGLIGATEAP